MARLMQSFDHIPDGKLITSIRQYMTEVLDENMSGALINHVREPWVNGLSKRNGADSVMGTVCEVMLLAVLYRQQIFAQLYLSDDKELQKEGIDVTAEYLSSDPTASPKVTSVSCKKNNYDPNKGFRLGEDYFLHRNGSRRRGIHHIAFVGEDGRCVVFNFTELADLFVSLELSRPHQNDNAYTYLTLRSIGFKGVYSIIDEMLYCDNVDTSSYLL